MNSLKYDTKCCVLQLPRLWIFWSKNSTVQRFVYTPEFERIIYWHSLHLCHLPSQTVFDQLRPICFLHMEHVISLFDAAFPTSFIRRKLDISVTSFNVEAHLLNFQYFFLLSNFDNFVYLPPEFITLVHWRLVYPILLNCCFTFQSGIFIRHLVSCTQIKS